MIIIKDIKAREILDSRGNPTVEATMYCNDNIVVKASVPSGASTGSKEALELRDNDLTHYNGKGVLKAVNNINTIIKDALVNKKVDQLMVDKILLELDGTENKQHLGANATLAVSLCAIKALAKSENKELYEYVSDGVVTMPIALVNIINGGMHAENNFQEFMIVPTMKKMANRIESATLIFKELKKILKEQGLETSVGDEGGFAPNLAYNTLALDFLVKAIKNAHYTPGKDVFIALDVAASTLYNEEKQTYHIDKKDLTKEELLQYYEEIVRAYPIISIEDPFVEDDLDSLATLTKILGDKILLVGDDTFVTNTKYLQMGINKQAGNAILLKANQIGTISEMINTIVLAKKNNYKTIISHRSGETNDTFIADFAVGLNIPFIKTGSMCRGERICKYNRLLEIEEKLLNR